jgi:hypothetical protein
MPVNEAMLPVPEAARPIDGALFVQLNTVPGTVPLKLVAATVLPLQTVWFVGWATVGVGLTVIVNVIGAPVQEAPALVEGVTVIVATTGVVLALVAVKAAMLPVPDAARPIDGALFVQENVVPGTDPL